MFRNRFANLGRVAQFPQCQFGEQRRQGIFGVAATARVRQRQVKSELAGLQIQAFPKPPLRAIQVAGLLAVVTAGQADPGILAELAVPFYSGADIDCAGLQIPQNIPLLVLYFS